MSAAVTSLPLAVARGGAASKRLFRYALLIATVVPFFAGAGAIFFPWGQLGLIGAIAFLSGIHVPLTIYLLFDGRIRQTIARRPLIFIGIPVFVFLGLGVVACLQWPLVVAGKSVALAALLLATYMWQMYHFGKQNIGVYAFIRSSAGRGPMPPIEKRFITAAAWIGVLASYSAYGLVIFRFAKNVPLGPLTASLAFLGSVGMVVQYGLLLVSLVYLLIHRRQFTFGIGAMFLLSVNFFLPQFLLSGKVPIGGIFAYYIFSHGLQYIVFLGFHALNFPAESARGQRSWLPRLAMILAFAGCFYFVGDLYFYHRFVSQDLIAGWISHVLFHSGRYVAALSFTLIYAVLLNHFWLDSFFWRGRDPSARVWMSDRFAFVLKS